MKMGNLATLSSPRSRLVSFSFTAVRSVSPKCEKGQCSGQGTQYRLPVDLSVHEANVVLMLIHVDQRYPFNVAFEGGKKKLSSQFRTNSVLK